MGLATTTAGTPPRTLVPPPEGAAGSVHFVPIDRLRTSYARLRAGAGRPRRQGDPAEGPLRAAAGETTGMMVMSIAPDGPGAVAGVTAGDILLTIDGTSMRGLRRVIAQLDDASVGRTVALRLIRGGEVLTLNVLITARPRQ